MQVAAGGRGWMPLCLGEPSLRTWLVGKLQPRDWISSAAMAEAAEGRSGPDGVTLTAFGLFVTLAGGNVIAVRYISCEACELDPFWAAATRFLIASAIFAVVALALRTGMPRGRGLVGAVLYGVLGFGAAFAFAYWGLQRVSGGFGAVLLATVPLLTFVFALAHRQERFRWGGLAGGILAIAGMAVIFREGVGAGVPLTSLLASSPARPASPRPASW